MVSEKRQWLQSTSIFSTTKIPRVVFFGSSRGLAGFIPETFDALAGRRVESINFAHQGGGREVVSYLEQMMQLDNKPTHVILSQCLQAKSKDYGTWRDDDWIMSRLFPFRRFARAVVLWVVKSISGDGFLETLKGSDQAIADLRQARGYHFIAQLSMFPDHQLPSDLMTSADRPEDIVSRPCTPEDPEFVKLRKLKNQYGFRVIVAPTAVRENSLAEAVEIDSWEHADITVAGPYYWRLPSKYFADFKHLNRAGAELYTKRLWELLAPELLDHGQRH